MPLLSKAELLDRTLHSIRRSGWTPLVLRDEHPFPVRAIRGDESVAMRIYIWNMTKGGPAGFRPADEWRIQITGVDSPLMLPTDEIPLLLGWHEEYRVFAGYDVVRHRTFGSSPSLQVRERTLLDGQRGMAFQQRTSEDIVVAFAPDQLMHYASNWPELHEFRQEREVEILETAARRDAVPDEELDVIPTQRHAVVTNVQRWSRERNFRVRVLGAYRGHCAMCILQLELVHAAHIIPVGYPESNDLTSNGLCLCPLHHRAYDDGLLAVWPDYHIRVNDARLQALIGMGLGEGSDEMRTFECRTILLPDRALDRPQPEYLRQGLRARGWPT